MSEPLLCFGREPARPGCVVSPGCEDVCYQHQSAVLIKVRARLDELEAGARRHRPDTPATTFEDGVLATVAAIRAVLGPPAQRGKR